MVGMSRTVSYPLNDECTEWIERPTLPEFSAYEVAVMFPGTVTVCTEVLKELNQKISELLELRRTLQSVFASDENTRWVYDTFYVQMPIDKYVKQIEFLEKVRMFQRSGKALGHGGDLKISIEQAQQVPIGEFLKFNRAHKAPCLWHQEKTASLYWNSKTNWVHCFGCGVNKNSIHVVMQLRGVKFLEAVKWILKK